MGCSRSWHRWALNEYGMWKEWAGGGCKTSMGCGRSGGVCMTGMGCARCWRRGEGA